LVRMAEKVGRFLSKVLVDLYQRVIADPSNRGVLLVNSAAALTYICTSHTAPAAGRTAL
jgi:hypothetical protein